MGKPMSASDPYRLGIKRLLHNRAFEMRRDIQIKLGTLTTMSQEAGLLEELSGRLGKNTVESPTVEQLMDVVSEQLEAHGPAYAKLRIRTLRALLNLAEQDRAPDPHAPFVPAFYG